MSQFSQVPRISYRAKFAPTRQFPEVPQYAIANGAKPRNLSRPSPVRWLLLYWPSSPTSLRRKGAAYRLSPNAMTPGIRWKLYMALHAPKGGRRLQCQPQWFPDSYIGDNEQTGKSALAYQYAKNKEVNTYDADRAFRWAMKKIGNVSGKGTWEGHARDAAQEGFIRWVNAGGKVNPITCVRSALLNILRREGLSQKIMTPLELGTVEPVAREEREGAGFKISQLPPSLQWIASQIAEGRGTREIRKEMGVGRETVDRMRRQLREVMEELLG